MKYTLLDGIEQNRLYPDTFHIPDRAEIQSLRPGYFVKLCFEEENNTPERMWVVITNIDGDNFTGILENEPLDIKSISYSDTVCFNSKHILDTME